MSKITTEQIKKLREETGAPVMECRQALEVSSGDEKKAKEYLRVKGVERAEKKSAREVKAGLVEAYTHAGGKIGVLVEVLCETDFVARNSEFKNLVHELALQVAAMNPVSVEELLEQEWIRDPSKKVGDLIKEAIGKIGENIKVSRISRIALNE